MAEKVKKIKEKKISVNMLEKAQWNNIVQVPFQCGEDMVTVSIHRILPLQKMLEFVETVVSSVVDIEEGIYTPAIKDMLIRKMTLVLYANFTMPQNAEKQYDLLYNTGAYDLICENIDLNSFNEIKIAIDSKINHLLNEWNSTAANQMREFVGRVGDAIDKFDTIFSGVNSDEFSSFVRNISRLENVDPSGIVDAIMERDAKDATAEDADAGLTLLKSTDTEASE